MTTFTAGQRLRASQVQLISDTADLALNPPSCVVTRSTAQTGIVSSAVTAISFDTEAQDNAGMFSPTSTTITIKRAGTYKVGAYCAIEANTTQTGYRRLLIELNGAANYVVIDQRTAVVGDATHMTIEGTLKLALNDTLKLYVDHNAGANRSTSGTPRFWATWDSV